MLVQSKAWVTHNQWVSVQSFVTNDDNTITIDGFTMLYYYIPVHAEQRLVLATSWSHGTWEQTSLNAIKMFIFLFGLLEPLHHIIIMLLLWLHVSSRYCTKTPYLIPIIFFYFHAFSAYVTVPFCHIDKLYEYICMSFITQGRSSEKEVTSLQSAS